MKLFLVVGTAFVALAASVALAADPKPAGEMQFTTLSGDQFDLAKAGGRGCIVMYFSTDCPHCQTTAERLAPVYPDLKAQGIEIVGLAMNPGAKQNLRTFVRKHKVAFPVGFADRQHFSRFLRHQAAREGTLSWRLEVGRVGSHRQAR